SDQTLDGVQRIRRIGHRLPLGWPSDQRLIVVSEGNDTRRSALAFSVFDDFRLITIQYGHTRVRGAKINTYDFAHNVLTLSVRRVAASQECCAVKLTVTELG